MSRGHERARERLSIRPRALSLHAALWPRAADYLDAHEIARLIAAAIPSAVIDWQRGDQVVQALLNELVGSTVPDEILASARRRLGHVAHVSVAFAEWPECLATFCVDVVNSELGDAIEVRAEPFDLPLLKHAAREIGNVLDCDFLLSSDDGGITLRTTQGGVADAYAFAREHYDEHAYPSVQVAELADWQQTIRHVTVRWLAACDKPDLVSTTIAGFDSPAAYADALVAELEEISPVQRIWSVDTAMSHQNTILLDHADWTTLLDLSGVPRGIVGKG